MPLATRQKKPGETRTFTFNFDRKLLAGDALTGSPTIVVPAALTLVASSRVNNRVSLRLSGGDEGTSHTITVSCASVNGDTVELGMTLEIRQSVN